HRYFQIDALDECARKSAQLVQAFKLDLSTESKVHEAFLPGCVSGGLPGRSSRCCNFLWNCCGDFLREPHEEHCGDSRRCNYMHSTSWKGGALDINARNINLIRAGLPR